MGIDFEFQYRDREGFWPTAGYGTGDTASDYFTDLLEREGNTLPIAEYVARAPDGTPQKIGSASSRSDELEAAA